MKTSASLFALSLVLLHVASFNQMDASLCAMDAVFTAAFGALMVFHMSRNKSND